MNLSSLYKQLKKRLRQKRRWLSLGFFIVAAAVGLLASYALRSPDAPREDESRSLQTWAVFESGTPHDTEASVQTLNQIREAGGRRDVYMRKQYVCGEENSLIGHMAADDVVRLHDEHPQWSVELGDDGTVTFIEKIDDLSSACKDNAYFGVDKSGNLSLFDGPPNEEKVIRTFFQLNMGYLESSLQPEAVDQLKEGIRVLDMEEYNSVLSTFSEFAVEDTEKVMKPAQ